jgi:superfamily II DNA/RNA helicase
VLTWLFCSELAFQIRDTFEALGAGIGLKSRTGLGRPYFSC